MRGWLLAIERQPDPHQVVVDGVIPQGAGRVGQVAVAAGQILLSKAVQHALVAALLLARQAVVLVGAGIGVGEVGIEPHQVHGIEILQGRHQAGAVLPVGAEPGHAGVELELQRHRATAAAGQVLAEQGFPHAADRRHQLPAQTAAQFLHLGEVAQHQNRRPDPGGAQFHPLGEGGHPEAAGAAGEGGLGDQHRTVAVAIRLDHGHQLGDRPDEAAQGAGVGADGAGIHLHPGPLPGLAGLMGCQGCAERRGGHQRLTTAARSR